MKRILFLLSAFLYFAAAQVQETVNLSFRSLDEMTNSTVQTWQTNITAMVGGNAALGDTSVSYWYFAPGDATAVDNSTVLPVTGVGGRWRRNASTNLNGYSLMNGLSVSNLIGTLVTTNHPVQVVSTVNDLYTSATNIPAIVTDTNRGGLFTHVNAPYTTVLRSMRNTTNGVAIINGGSGYALRPYSYFVIDAGTGYTNGPGFIRFPHNTGGTNLYVHLIVTTGGNVAAITHTNIGGGYSYATYWCHSSIPALSVVEQGAATSATAIAGDYLPLSRTIAGGTFTTAAKVEITEVLNGVATAARIAAPTVSTLAVTDNSGIYSAFPGTNYGGYFFSGISNSVSGAEAPMEFHVSLPVGYYYPASDGTYWARYVGPNDPINMAFLVGDTYDNSLQFRTAVSLAQSLGKDLFTPAGSYNFNSWCFVPRVENFVWRGEGGSIIRLTGWPHLTDVIDLTGGETGRPKYTTFEGYFPITFFSPTNIIVKQLKFTGPSTGDPKTNSPLCVINFDFGSDSTTNGLASVEDCSFEWVRLAAIYMTASDLPNIRGQKVTRNQFIRCLKDHNQTGASLIGNLAGSWEVSHNLFSDCGVAPWTEATHTHFHLLYPGSSRNFSVIGNTIIADKSTNMMDMICGYAGTSTNGIVANNIFYGYEDAPRRALQVASENVTVQNNQLYNATLNLLTKSASIVGNTFWMKYSTNLGNSGYSISAEVSGFPANSMKLRVADNVFTMGNLTNTFEYAPWEYGGGIQPGLYFGGLSDSVIENNTFDHVPIYFQYATNLVVRNNTTYYSKYARLSDSTASAYKFVYVTNLTVVNNVVDVQDSYIRAFSGVTIGQNITFHGNWGGVGTFNVGGLINNGASTYRDGWQNLRPPTHNGKHSTNDTVGLAEANYGKNFTISAGDVAMTNLITQARHTNGPGGSLFLQSGRGNGIGTNAIVFQTASTGSGMLQSYSPRAIIDHAGLFKVYGQTLGLNINTLWSSNGVPGVHTGAVGSLYMRTDGTPGTALYVNTNGATTGWSPLAIGYDYVQKSGDTMGGSLVITNAAGSSFTLTATNWVDSMSAVTADITGGTALTLNTNTCGYQFQKGDIAYGTIQFNHDVKTGSPVTIYPHIHLLKTVAQDTPGGAGSNVVFNIAFREAAIGSVLSSWSANQITNTIDVTGNTNAYAHQILNVPAAGVTITPGISHIVSLRIERVNKADDNYVAGDVVMTHFDIHYQANTHGSAASTSK